MVRIFRRAFGHHLCGEQHLFAGRRPASKLEWGDGVPQRSHAAALDGCRGVFQSCALSVRKRAAHIQRLPQRRNGAGGCDPYEEHALPRKVESPVPGGGVQHLQLRQVCSAQPEFRQSSIRRCRGARQSSADCTVRLETRLLVRSSPKAATRPPALTITTSLGGRRITPSSAGVIPGQVGLGQVTLLIPPDMAAGEHGFSITAGGTNSNTCQIAVAR
ncbi:MAG: hypothetical protein FJW38_27745 [Acidobacteria bacterium]|nr:hypothetical protein [Acidobacteriota bacterium]